MLHKLPRFLSYLLPRTTHKEPIAHNFLDARGSVAEKWREFCSTGLLSGVLPPSADDFFKTLVLFSLEISDEPLIS
jgi:hypothetical protein